MLDAPPKMPSPRKRNPDRKIGGRHEGDFRPGNELWRLGLDRSGAPPIYDDPEKLWADCVGYFDWVEANPLYEAELVTYQGKSQLERIPKMRAMSQTALCLHLGIGRKTWQTWRDRALLAGVVERVDAIIWAQKFEGGAAGLLNPMMIARDLGLSDKTELSGRDGGAIRTEATVVVLPANGRD